MNILDFQLLCYGKLPLHGDFIRYNASNPVIQEFDLWLQDGLSHAHARLQANWDNIYNKAPTYCFMLPQKAYQKVFIGLMKPSFDKIGRKYPFVIGTLVDKEVVKPDFGAKFLIQFKFFFDKAWLVLENLFKNPVGQDLEREFKNIAELSVENANQLVLAYHQYKNSTTIENYFDLIAPDLGEQNKNIILRNIAEVFLPQHDYNMSNTKFGIRFPLGIETQPRHFITSFWLEVLKILNPNYSEIPNIYFTYTPGKAYLFLFLNYPSPKIFLDLLNPNEASDFTFAVEKIADDNFTRVKENLPADLKHLAESSAINLYQFLDELSKLSIC